MLQQHERYVSHGSFEGRIFLYFNTPSYIADFYPNLLSTKGHDRNGLSLVVTAFTNPSTFTPSSYEAQWFSINARIIPYKLPFARKLTGLETAGDNWPVDKVALALPRDNGMQR